MQVTQAGKGGVNSCMCAGLWNPTQLWLVLFVINCKVKPALMIVITRDSVILLLTLKSYTTNIKTIAMSDWTWTCPSDVCMLYGQLHLFMTYLQALREQVGSCSFYADLTS